MPPPRRCATPRTIRYTPAVGPPGAPRGDRREDAARLGARGRRLAGHRHQRRQAGRLPGVPGGREPGRRGAAARALLDDLPRGDRARRRRARRGVRRRRPGLQGHRRAARGRAHRQDDGRSCSSRRRTRPARSTRPKRPRRSASGPSSTASGSSPTRSTRTSSTKACAPSRSSRRFRMPRPRRSSSTASPRPTR